MPHAPPLTGPLLRQYRRALGLKQVELGEEIGVTQAAISLAEAGRMPLSEGLQASIRRRFDRAGVEPRLSDFVAQLQREAPPALTRQASVTLPVYRWSSPFAVRDEPREAPVDLVTLRVAGPAIALAMPSATDRWAADEILVFALCEPGDCRPDDLALIQPGGRRNAASLIAAVERPKGRGAADRRFVPVHPEGPAIPLTADWIELAARCVYRARYTGQRPA